MSYAPTLVQLTSLLRQSSQRRSTFVNAESGIKKSSTQVFSQFLNDEDNPLSDTASSLRYQLAHEKNKNQNLKDNAKTESKPTKHVAFNIIRSEGDDLAKKPRLDSYHHITIGINKKADIYETRASTDTNEQQYLGITVSTTTAANYDTPRVISREPAEKGFLNKVVGCCFYREKVLPFLSEQQVKGYLMRKTFHNLFRETYQSLR